MNDQRVEMREDEAVPELQREAGNFPAIPIENGFAEQAPDGNHFDQGKVIIFDFTIKLHHLSIKKFVYHVGKPKSFLNLLKLSSTNATYYIKSYCSSFIVYADVFACVYAACLGFFEIGISKRSKVP